MRWAGSYSSITNQDGNRDTPAFRNGESLFSLSKNNITLERAQKCFEQALPNLICAAIIGGYLNFMVFIVLKVQDNELHKNVEEIWNTAQCKIIIRTCSCNCCMLRPLVSCQCPYSDVNSCESYCPMDDQQPPLDADCNVPGRTVQTQDSYWSPGRPSCFLKYHRSALVEYNVSSDHRQVAGIYEVCVLDVDDGL